MKKIIDSHVHLDMINSYSSNMLSIYRKSRTIMISWSFWKKIIDIFQLKYYLKHQSYFLKNIANKFNLTCYYLTGIHPRNIPKGLKIDELIDILLLNLSDKRCLGIGEIGLETGDFFEIDVLKAQLDMALSIKKENFKIGIHTPRYKKYDITNKILEILNDYNFSKKNILIDHCNADTLPIVINNGYMAGITLDPQKINLTILLDVINKYKKNLSQMMCNSDNGGNSSNYFFKIENYISTVLKKEKKNKLFFDTAYKFFNLEKFDSLKTESN